MMWEPVAIDETSADLTANIAFPPIGIWAGRVLLAWYLCKGKRD